jgi:NAD kinase
MSKRELSNDTIGELFMNVLQHMKCVQIRIEFAKHFTSQKQKYALETSAKKVRTAIDNICDLLGDSSMVLKVKKELNKTDMVYVMLLTEKFSRLTRDELEEVDQILEDFINKKRSL